MSESIWNDPRITAYVLDELPSDERSEFEQEMNSNEELAAAVAEARGVTSQLGELYLDEGTPPLDIQRREAILTLESAPDSNDAIMKVADETSWRLPLAIMATAATLLLLLGLAPWMAEQKSEIAMQRAHESDTGVEATSPDVSEREEMVEMLGQSRADDYSTLADEGNGVANGKASEMLSSLPASRMSMASESKMEPETRRFGDDRATGFSEAAKETSTKQSDPQMSPTSESASANQTHWGMRSGRVAADGEPEDVGEIGDVQVQAVPELGAIVVRGAKKDVQRVLDVVKQVETNANSASDFDDGLGTIKDQIVLPPLDKQIADASGEPIRYSRIAGDVIEQDGAVDMQSENRGKDESFEFDVAKPSPTSAIAPSAPFGGPANHPGSQIALVPEPAEAKYALGGQVAGAEAAFGAGSAPDRYGETELRLDAIRLTQLNEAVDYDEAKPEGTGPGKPGDQFEPITDNPFQRVSEHPLSTFSVDVDTASYSKTRDFLMRANQLPRPDAVRIEELINYFDYDYAGPDADSDHPFIARAVVTGCPWNEEHRLARIAIKGKEMEAKDRPKCNLVFLIDTSGSMNAHNKLPLVLQGMEMLVDRLNKKDRVAITVYAGSAGLVLDSTKVGKNGNEIKNALARLSAGGSTNGGAGIALAYQTARDNFIKDGVNRVILCTDGDFNVGLTGTDALVRMVEKEAKGGVFLSVLGFGMGNHNDAMLEQVSGRGNGNYAFIDTENEARKVLVEQTSATLVTIAKDVKLQIEFNPSKVSSYRLIGYENRILAKEDFNDDKKDAGEIGAGHEVTALYEIVPSGMEVEPSAPKVDPLKYQQELKPTEAADSDEMVTVKLRYKQPDGDESTLVEFPVRDDGQSFDDMDADVRFAASVAGFGMQLRRSDYRGDWTLRDVMSVAEGATGEDEFGLRAEFLTMVRKASELMGQQ